MKQFMVLLFLVGSFQFVTAQTRLEGTVRDAETGEPVVFGTVALYQNGVLITGTETDFDGYYSITELAPGVYDVEFMTTGYTPNKVSSYSVYLDIVNKLDWQLEAGIEIFGCPIITMTIPLLRQDDTTQGQVFSTEEIRHSPIR